MPGPASLEEFAAAIVRSRLMSSADLVGVLQDVRPSGSAAADLEAARRLLVSGKHLTEYQAAHLLRGHTDGFFLGPYKVLDRIAKGRMAGVYKAVHESGQVVAIKVLPASKAKDPETLARFKREGRLLTQLDHPNVVRAFALGEADGKHYLALEYLEGETLEEVLQKRKRLPPPDAVRIIHDAMVGLQHIHQKGMIHRDLKPANLMLLRRDEGGGVRDEGRQGSVSSPTPPPSSLPLVKILDIGLGKAVFEEGDTVQKITGDGVLIGTPDYLAPEQAKNARAVDIRSDIYSLGCVLFHALTGQPPFPDKSILNQVMRHATEPPRPLSDFLPEVPPGLQDVMNWLLAKDPAQRYPTPERAAQALSVLIRPTPPAKPSAPTFVEAVSTPTKEYPIGKLQAPARKSGPLPPVPPTPAAAPIEVDVELVSVPPEPVRRRKAEEEPRGWLELNRRDAVMLITGGTLTSLALLAGWGLYRLLRVEPPPDTSPPGKPQEG
jgi:serine/threonine protein kinase